jgi:hypothetical protein
MNKNINNLKHTFYFIKKSNKIVKNKYNYKNSIT